MKTFHDPGSLAAAHNAALGAYEQLSNRLRPDAWVEIRMAPPELRTIKAGMMALSAVAAVLGCKVRDAWGLFEVAMRPAVAPVSGQDRPLDDTFVQLTVAASAFYHLTHGGGHLPTALLAAVEKDLDLQHTFFNCPNLVAVFREAVR